MITENTHIALDLDGTLAFYDGWKGDDHIGDPIPAMAEKFLEWHAKGIKVSIFTARVSALDADEAAYAAQQIGKWLIKHNLPRVYITCIKHKHFTHFIDDRAVAVVTNEGLPKGML